MKQPTGNLVAPTEQIAQVKKAFKAFKALKAFCPYLDDTDCGHPKIDFTHMLCAACNCPLLLTE